MKSTSIVSTLGSSDILKCPKTAFLCSRKIPPTVVLKCYDWALEQRDKGICVISGFHSMIEKDILHFLLTGKQPIIIVLSRGMIKRIDTKLKEALNENRLLIISPFPDNSTRPSQYKAQKRNRLMLDLADEIVIGYATKNGLLSSLINQYPPSKPISYIQK